MMMRPTLNPQTCSPGLSLKPDLAERNLEFRIPALARPVSVLTSHTAFQSQFMRPFSVAYPSFSAPSGLVLK